MGIIGTTLASKRWGNGFQRRVGMMQVVRLDGDQGYVARHRDTALGKDRAVRAGRLSELSGFFGFCPRAIEVYKELGIPVRQVA